EQTFVEAARAIGAKPLRIMSRHVFPNTVAPLIVQGTFVGATAILIEAGLSVCRPEATFHVWMRCPEGLSSTDFAALLLEKADIVATPGVGLGQYGEGYVRMCLTVDEDRLREAALRVKALNL
ncbi:MAG: aminotransferase class I/II-fold pyridoxal phosphate-dependent enzyme, partial [Phycisphaerae bacterium]|nr:aminotransferase class I/II-fold pyridoxal phosphate-dependent enzyme [Phycisphaerae bacterium]